MFIATGLGPIPARRCTSSISRRRTSTTPTTATSTRRTATTRSSTIIWRSRATWSATATRSSTWRSGAGPRMAPFVLGEEGYAKYPNVKRLVDEITGTPGGRPRHRAEGQAHLQGRDGRRGPRHHVRPHQEQGGVTPPVARAWGGQRRVSAVPTRTARDGGHASALLTLRSRSWRPMQLGLIGPPIMVRNVGAARRRCLATRCSLMAASSRHAPVLAPLPDAAEQCREYGRHRHPTPALRPVAGKNTRQCAQPAARTCGAGNAPSARLGQHRVAIFPDLLDPAAFEADTRGSSRYRSAGPPWSGCSPWPRPQRCRRRR